MRQGVEDGLEIPAGERETPENQQDQDDDADDGKHAQSTPIGTCRVPANKGVWMINGSGREILSASAQNIEKRLAIDPRKGRLRRFERQIGDRKSPRLNSSH